MNIARLFAITAVSGILLGCGTTSGIKPSPQDAVDQPATFDVARFSSVTVIDFENMTGSPNADGAGRVFADLIAQAIEASGSFDTVARTPTGNETLLIFGDITRHEEGNAATRLWIGLGAGLAHFDAAVRFADTVADNQIGMVEVDRNSWALGGALAASQDLDYLMGQAAEKIADQLAAARQSRDGD